jgi:hypothetical protein
MDMLLAGGHIEFVPLATLVEAILRYKALSGVEEFFTKFAKEHRAVTRAQ